MADLGAQPEPTGANAAASHPVSLRSSIAQIQGQALKARSAVDAVEAVPYLSTLLSALKAVNLSDALGPTFNGTLIAPQDSVGRGGLPCLLVLAW
jgi:hypothetical protein